MPKISVILTSFNHGKYINEAIDSVLKQRFVDFELIIWDDASVDDSWNIIQSYNDPRIQVFQNSQNQGPVYGINKAIFEIASGEYIAIHHSDDAWELDKLEKQLEFLDANPNTGAVFSNVQPIDQRGVLLTDQTHHYYSIFSQPNRSRYEWLRHFFLKGNALCHPSILIRKQCYSDCGAYRDMLAQLPDFDMWIRLCAKYEIHVMEERLVKFRILDGEMNTSGNRPITRTRHTTEYYKLLQQYRTLLGIDNIFEIFPDFIAYNRGEDTDSEYVLSRVCLESNGSYLGQLIAIEILFDILNNPVRRQVIESIYGFSVNDFIALSGQCDLLSHQKLFNQIIECDKQIKILSQRVHDIETSRSWRIVRKLNRLINGKLRFKVFVRRIVKLLWWTITLQLPTKLRGRYALFKIQQSHYSPPCDDYRFAVPFYYPIVKPSNPPSLAVICHLYYPELLGEFKHYLANIPFTFDLFITTDSEQKKVFIANCLKDWNKGAVEIRVSPNRGRDIAPKLITCRDIYMRYEFFLHIHSKKSPHQDALSGWRFYLLENLLGSEEIVSSIFEAFASDHKLGMIAPEHTDILRNSTGWGFNFDAAQPLARQLGLELSLNNKIDFPSGSMFWGRSAAIKPLLELNLRTEDFPVENKQTDATLAHVIERLYFFVCELAGFRWIKIANPVLLENPQSTIWVDSKDELIEEIQRTQFHLLASTEK
jgi:glycosyltransferase involved in cell wall biosynthesis